MSLQNFVALLRGSWTSVSFFSLREWRNECVSPLISWLNLPSPPLHTGVLVLAYSLLSRVYGMLKAAHSTHLHMLGAVLRAPPAFFESNPSGRLLNRFGKDVDTIDCLIPENIDIWMRTFWYTVTVLVICSALTPMFFIVIVPLTMFYWWVQVNRNINSLMQHANVFPYVLVIVAVVHAVVWLLGLDVWECLSSVVLYPALRGAF